MHTRAIREKLYFVDVNGPNEQAGLFEESEPFEQSTAWACVVYSLVPFVGILFTLPAVVLGIRELLNARFAGNSHAVRSRIFAIVTGVVVLAAQLVLWWLLYHIPTLDR